MIYLRLIQLRKTLNLTQFEFGEKIGLKHSTISDIERNYSPLTESNKILICKTFNVNRVWLETGIGPMFIEHNPLHDEFILLFDNLDINFQQFLLDTAKRLLDLQDNIL